MDELIERLREEAASWDLLICDGATDREAINRNSHASRRAALLREAAAALEAARADAERYRWLRKGNNDDIAVVRGLGAMDYGMSAVVSTYSEEIDGDDLDAAIDQARGKAGGEVEGG